jgi:hypothetical protein
MAAGEGFECCQVLYETTEKKKKVTTKDIPYGDSHWKRIDKNNMERIKTGGPDIWLASVQAMSCVKFVLNNSIGDNLKIYKKYTPAAFDEYAFVRPIGTLDIHIRALYPSHDDKIVFIVSKPYKVTVEVPVSASVSVLNKAMKAQFDNVVSQNWAVNYVHKGKPLTFGANAKVARAFGFDVKLSKKASQNRKIKEFCPEHY